MRACQLTETNVRQKKICNRRFIYVDDESLMKYIQCSWRLAGTKGIIDAKTHQLTLNFLNKECKNKFCLKRLKVTQLFKDYIETKRKL